MAAERDGSNRGCMGLCAVARLLAGHLRGGDLPLGRAVVRGAADVHQDGAAAARRLAAGVVGGDGVLPGRAARRLCLCASADAPSARPRCRSSSMWRVMLVATFALPLAIASGWGRPPAEGEAFWLLGLFAVSIGLPFFALSANGPLLQAWFARTGHPARGGSVFPLCGEQRRQLPCAALLSVRGRAVHAARRPDPHVVGRLLHADRADRRLRRAAHASRCAARHRRASRARRASRRQATVDRGRAPPSWRDAATWVALAAVPSGLLIAVTAHVSTDVAAVAVPLGDPARALPPDLRDRVPVEADHSPSLVVVVAAGLHHRPGRRAGVSAGSTTSC